MSQSDIVVNLAESEMTASSFIETIAPMTATSGQVELVKELGKITPSDSILELWCGAGDLTAQLASIGGRTVGVDYSKKLIDAAAERFPRVEFTCSEADKLEFDDETFNVVVSNYTAHHYAEPEKIFVEALRVLRPGGRFIMTMPIQSKRTAFNEVLGVARQHLKLPAKVLTGGPLIDVETPDQVALVLRRANFAEVTAKICVVDAAYDSTNTIINYAFRKIGLEQASIETQNLIRIEARAALENYLGADARYHFSDSILAACGTKII